jgi:ornithine--oxo-acid transaminase
MDLETQFCAHNYHSLPVLITRGEGVFVWDDAGKKYLDMMSAYSSVSHAHANPLLVDLLQTQVAQPRLTGP